MELGQRARGVGQLRRGEPGLDGDDDLARGSTHERQDHAQAPLGRPAEVASPGGDVAQELRATALLEPGREIGPVTERLQLPRQRAAGGIGGRPGFVAHRGQYADFNRPPNVPAAPPKHAADRPPDAGARRRGRGPRARSRPRRALDRAGRTSPRTHPDAPPAGAARGARAATSRLPVATSPRAGGCPDRRARRPRARHPGRRPRHPAT